ncbi:MAG: HIT domain-containing protein [Dokdonella sp.]|uniref:HIT domain-containing protein n=1 Tax=Dokdonella sp. TaxID=2291710 RepID=UPI003F7DF4F5
MSFRLDPRLAADTHAIGDGALSRLLLMDDARFPWLILVPRIAGARELFDLDAVDRVSLLAELDGVGRAFEALLRPDKMNIAALGNVVPQLHVHVIARYTNDAAWPRPVWGEGQAQRYEPTMLAARIDAIRGAMGALLA